VTRLSWVDGAPVSDLAEFKPLRPATGSETGVPTAQR
jgi:hypothetical protein